MAVLPLFCSGMCLNVCGEAILQHSKGGFHICPNLFTTAHQNQAQDRQGCSICILALMGVNYVQFKNNFFFIYSIYMAPAYPCQAQAHGYIQEGRFARPKSSVYVLYSFFLKLQIVSTYPIQCCSG